MDGIHIGRGMGTVLAEAVKEAGAVGVMLNHAEKKMFLKDIEAAIKRADEIGLATMVCGDTFDEIKEIAKLAPNIIVAEPTELIGTGKAVDKEYVEKCISIIRNINLDILVLPSAGISCGQDCYNIIKLGAEATGSSSGIVKAENPAATAEEMITAVVRAWKE